MNLRPRLHRTRLGILHRQDRNGFVGIDHDCGHVGVCPVFASVVKFNAIQADTLVKGIGRLSRINLNLLHARHTDFWPRDEKDRPQLPEQCPHTGGLSR